MKLRRGISNQVVVLAVLLIIAVIAAGYFAVGKPATTTSVTSTLTVTASQSQSTVKEGPLVSYSADAYAAEVTSLLNGFSTSTGVPVAPLKSGGSFADANAIAAGAPDDVFVSSALSATSSEYLKNLTSGWAVAFATDQMVVAYANGTEPAAASGVISLGSAAEQSNTTSAWNGFFTALTNGSVSVGISNPVSDPGGLRGWLVLEAAGYFYGGGNQQAYTSSLLQAKANVTGTNSAALVAPLESGQIQFLFIYRSAAISDGLKFIALDPHVNLGTPSLGSFYSKFTYTDSAGTTAGAPISICVTIPLSAANQGEAVEFVQYVVQNAKSLSTFGLEPLTPALLYGSGAPTSLQQLVSQGLIEQSAALP